MDKEISGLRWWLKDAAGWPKGQDQESSQQNNFNQVKEGYNKKETSQGRGEEETEHQCPNSSLS